MKYSEKITAVALRRKGESIKHIANRLSVSPGTVSRWCKDIVLNPKQRNRLTQAQQKAAREALAPWIQKRRDEKIADVIRQKQLGKRDVRATSKKELLTFGLGLYCGEGYKRGSQEWGFTNSDPAVIRVMLAWLRECYGVAIDRIIARLTLNTRYADQEDRLITAWVRETRIPRGQFGMSAFITTPGKEKIFDRTYWGTLRIKVRRGTSLRRRILASISEVENQIALNSRKTFS